MNAIREKFDHLTRAWLALLGLTCISFSLGEWFRSALWVTPLVAGLIWLKATLVSRHFLESGEAHPFVAWLLKAFIAFAPAALVLTAVVTELAAR